jgi:biotin-[acetyl-CoA-carboxylase] ligase BirA-like protein
MTAKTKSSSSLPHRGDPDPKKNSSKGLRAKRSNLCFTIRHFKELRSTNTHLQKLAAEGAEEGLVIVADYQTEGRGKPGRQWISPAGKNLLFSVLLRPPISQAEAPMITQIACRSVAAILKNEFGLDPAFKRPNDILINGKKICGVLTESSSSLTQLKSVIIGIGLNVNATADELVSSNCHPESQSCHSEQSEESPSSKSKKTTEILSAHQTGGPAGLIGGRFAQDDIKRTSIYELTGKTVDLKPLLKKILNQLQEDVQSLYARSS